MHATALAAPAAMPAPSSLRIRAGFAASRVAVAAMVLVATASAFIASNDTALMASRWARFLTA
jgi:hypothetical protein